MTALLSIEDLVVGLPSGGDRDFAVNHVSLDLQENEILCVVGESGSGKSVLASSILRLLPPELPVKGGRISFDGVDLLGLTPSQMGAIRGARIGMIFQDPMTALNPLHRIGDQIAETFRIHTSLGTREIRDRVLTLLEKMHLSEPSRVARSYPHQISGGQRQRAMIAMALALEPRVLIADEPTTALDVTTQAQILALIGELQARNRMAVLFITHDFGVVAEIGSRIVVMQHGEMVECGSASQVLYEPSHPYTQRLIAAVPRLEPSKSKQPKTTGRPVLSMVNLTKTYRQRGRQTDALKEVSLTLPRESTLGIVGESGSGKSTLARCIVKLLTVDAGAIVLDGKDITRATRREWRIHYAPRVQMVFQDPYASLNPRHKAGDLVAQGPLLRGDKVADVKARVRELFALVGLDPAAVDRFPHQFSGGQRQRIGLARALALNPDILIADEAVSALDVSVQAQVLALLADLKQKLGLSMIFITHDLRVAAQICDRVAIMQHGKVVEEGLAEEILVAPKHPYSQRLLASMPGQAWQRGRPLQNGQTRQFVLGAAARITSI